MGARHRWLAHVLQRQTAVSRPFHSPLTLMVWAMMLAGLAVQPVEAQDTGPDPMELARVRLGNFGFTPAVRFTGGYDSNITDEPGAPADWEFVAVPQAEYWLSIGPTLFSGAGAVEFINYLDYEPALTVNHVGNISFTVPGATLRPTVGYSHRNLYAPPTGYELGERSRRIEDDAVAALSWTIGSRTRLTGEGRVLRLNWDAAAEYQGSNLRESLNRTSKSASVGVGTELTPLTSVGVTIQAISDRFEFSPQRDADSLQVLGTVTMAPPALVSGAALVGYRHFESPQSGAQDFDGLVANVFLAYVRESRTQVMLTFDRGPWFSYSENQGYFLMTSTSARYLQAISQNWDVSVFGGFSVLDFTVAGLSDADGENRRRTDLGGGFARRIGEFTRVGLDVNRIITRGSSAFDGWRAVAFVVYGSDRLQRLDRPLPEHR
jgi:hypothetical protein